MKRLLIFLILALSLSNFIKTSEETDNQEVKSEFITIKKTRKRYIPRSGKTRNNRNSKKLTALKKKRGASLLTNKATLIKYLNFYNQNIRPILDRKINLDFVF